MDFVYRFPAARGVQATREYFIAMVPLKMISKMFLFDSEYVPPEFRAQRRLNEARIPVISKYILENRDTYVFSALAASIDGSFHYTPSELNRDIGLLEVSMDARFLVNDGQHRKAAIIEALKEDPSLGEETISIVFFADKGLSHSQQIFTDLNKNAVKSSNSISELYDTRDKIAVITRNVICRVDFLNNYTDKEKDILGKYSSNLFTLNTFYSANKIILGTNPPDEQSQEFLYRFWYSVSEHMLPWKELDRREIPKVELRENYIVTQNVVIQALGRVGYFFGKHPEYEMEKRISMLDDIKWQRSTKVWLHRVIMPNGRIITNKRAIILIANVIKQRLGIPLDSTEKLIEDDYLKDVYK